LLSVNYSHLKHGRVKSTPGEASEIHVTYKDGIY